MFLFLKNRSVLLLASALIIGAGDRLSTAQDLGGSSEIGSTLGGSSSRSNRSGSGSSSSSRTTSRSGSGSSSSNSASGSSGTGRSRSTNPPSENDTRNQRNQATSERNRNNNLPGRGNNTTSPNPTRGGSTGTRAGQPTSVKGAPRKGGTIGTGKGAAAPQTTVQFQMKANPFTNVLYIEGINGLPTLNITSTEGETFATRTVLRNGRKSAFQTIDMTIRFEPQVIQPEGIDYEALDDLLQDEAIAQVDARRGIIYFHAVLAQPRTDDNFEIAKIRWQTVGPSANSPISFLNTPVNPSRILAPDGRTNILQTSSGTAESDVTQEADVEPSSRSGLLDASVAVSPNAATAEAIGEESGSLSGMAMVNSISAGTAQGGVQLALRPRSSFVRVGEEVLVDVVYSNPRQAEVDSFRLNIGFDPSVLQVVDYDEGNWISRGINIYDADYHEELPFSFHLRNVAYNATGEIRYEMGFNSRTRIPTAGTIATIRFKAVGSSPRTDIAFNLEEQSTDQRTVVSFLGFNLIGSPGQRTLAAQGAAVTVN